MSEPTNQGTSSHDAESVDPILWEDKSEKEMLVLLMSRLNQIESARVKENQEIRDEVRKLREEIKAGIEKLGNCRKILEEKIDGRSKALPEDKTSSQVRRDAATEPEERTGRVEERMVVEEEPDDVVAEDVADQRTDETPDVDPLSESYGHVFIKEEVDEDDHEGEGAKRRGFGGLAEIFLKMEDNSSSDELVSCVPPEKSETSGKTGGDDSLPPKSKVQYESAYNTFSYWRKKSGRKSSSETVLMAYFEELSKKWKPSTLWSTYSMLKSTINIKEKINIGEYPLLTAFLKKQSAGFHSKKSSVFTSEDIQRYLNEAPDIDFLATKVALILGVSGACRREELCNIRTKDINDTGSMAIITIPRTRKHAQRTFTIVGQFYNIFKSYASLRPANVVSDRFFLNFQNQKCTHQVIGINKFGGMPKQVASFLKLKDPEKYTGHSFRRTSASLIGDAGVDITSLRRHVGRAAEGCVEDSMRIGRRVTKSVVSGVDSASLRGPSPKKRKTVFNASRRSDSASMSTTETTTAENSSSSIKNSVPTSCVEEEIENTDETKEAI